MNRGSCRFYRFTANSSAFNVRRPYFRFASSLHAAPLPAHKPGRPIYITSLSAAVALTLFFWQNIRKESLSAEVVKERKQYISQEELCGHATKESLWLVVGKDVWDVTDWLPSHPGGADLLISNGTKDCTAAFRTFHPKGTLENAASSGAITKVGEIDPQANLVRAAAVVDNLEEVEERRKQLPELDTIPNLNEFERLAKDVLGAGSRGFSYISSYADSGETYDYNMNSFNFLRFIPRVLRPVSQVDASADLLGQKAALPVYLAPTGSSAFAHPDGELNLVETAALTGVPQCISSTASKSLEELFAKRDQLEKEGKGRARFWWQLYVRADRQLTTDKMLEAVNGGCEAVFLTVDTPVLGKREADTAGVAHQGAIGSSYSAKPLPVYDADINWADIKWIRDRAPNVKVYLKGIGSVEDALRAKQEGADGITLSNHGGRQLNFAPPGLATLVRMRMEHPELLNDPTFEVWVDGGVRRGTDVLKVLALGGKGVSLGRPMLYSQACYGAAGVQKAFSILQDEVERAMRLNGVTKLSEVDSSLLELLPGLVGQRFV